MRYSLSFMIAAFALGSGLAPVLAADTGTYRPGTPYETAVASNATVCDNQCKGDAQCRGWNYVKVNAKSPGICEFLSQVSAPVASTVSVSGMNMAGASSSRLVPGQTRTQRVGQAGSSVDNEGGQVRIIREPVEDSDVVVSGPVRAANYQRQYPTGQGQNVPARNYPPQGYPSQGYPPQTYPSQSYPHATTSRPLPNRQGRPVTRPHQRGIPRPPNMIDGTFEQMLDDGSVSPRRYPVPSTSPYPQSRPQPGYSGPQMQEPYGEPYYSQPYPNPSAARPQGAYGQDPAYRQNPAYGQSPAYGQNPVYNQGNRPSARPPYAAQGGPDPRSMTNPQTPPPSWQQAPQRRSGWSFPGMPPRQSTSSEGQNYGRPPVGQTIPAPPNSPNRQPQYAPPPYNGGPQAPQSQPPSYYNYGAQGGQPPSYQQGRSQGHPQGQGLYGNLYDDVRVPLANTPMPSDPNVPVTMTEKRPVMPVQQGQLPPPRP